MRDWPQPGDVAMVTNRFGVDNVAICAVAPGGFLWRYGVVDDADAVDDPARVARPLAVIDPEDREQVGRLCDAYKSVDHGIGSRHMQQALREFADPKPPKPPRPTGLGAVAVDTDGEVWVHFGNDCWIKQVPNANLHQKSYADIDVVELCADGVEPLADWERDLLRGAR